MSWNFDPEIEAGCGPFETQPQERDVSLVDLFGFLAERVRDLLFDSLETAVVDVRQQPQCEHVLSLARVLVDGEALLLHRNLDYPIRLRGKLGERLVPGGPDVGIRVRGPGILEQNYGVAREGAESVAAEKDLLVEGDDEVGFVAPVGDGSSAKADAIAARSLGHSRGWLDLGGDDLHRPDPVPHLGGDCSEDLAAFLRPLSGVGDYFYSMLRPIEDGRCSAKFDRQGDSGHWRIRLFSGEERILQFLPTE